MSDHVRIEMTSHGQGKVWINDREISVRKIEFRSAVNEVNSVVLELVPDRAEISGPANIIASVNIYNTAEPPRA